ncbi:hypothetical protein ACWGIA_23730 [Streptomyces bobili]
MPALHRRALPLLNGTVTHYRSRPVLTGHPAGRPCTDPSCPCPSRSPDQGHTARSGARADRYEAWMIHTRHYLLTGPDDQPGVIDGISTTVPVLRNATLPPEQEDLLNLLRSVLDGTE